ncbi:hypothetical protein SAMN05192529_101352 [Arachidicoccus rhizosphaerae]|uniref:Uncharacterized protein n=1 Tax=Arachidicoccus rhizosphaerae TaxID=551991 RepID=A0A1H3VQ15_9BACT|nr:hypothetical protein SAMN05192529_101352 [Arachidicoccus rhizosphaerae]
MQRKNTPFWQKSLPLRLSVYLGLSEKGIYFCHGYAVKDCFLLKNPFRLLTADNRILFGKQT